MTAASIRQAITSLDPLQRQFLEEDRFGEVERLAENFGISTDAVRSALRDLKPKARADRFEWLQKVTADHRVGVRGLRIANAMFSFAGQHGYLWPSQAGIAARAGYSDSAEVRRGLESLRLIGAIRKVRVVDLPKDLAAVAMGTAKDGGSARSFRGTAYVLVPPAEWAENSNTGTPRPSDNRDAESLYNLHVKPEPASPEELSSYSYVNQSTFQQAEMSQYGNDGGEHTSKLNHSGGQADV